MKVTIKVAAQNHSSDQEPKRKRIKWFLFVCDIIQKRQLKVEATATRDVEVAGKWHQMAVAWR